MATKAKKMMTNAVAWVEIPVRNLGRAKKFYEKLLDVEMIDLDMDQEFKMSMFPVEENGVGGALCEHKEFYHPSHEGSLIYFSANPDLQPTLDRVEQAGGKVMQEKTQINDEYGYMAIFEDSEGNRVALHSME